MEVKPGYKRTEVGFIPEDWDNGIMAFAVEKLEAGTSVNSDKEGTPDFDSYPCILKTGAAAGGTLHPQECKKVARRDLSRLTLALRKDTILISRMNTIELVGESAFVKTDYPYLFVPDRLWMATIRPPVHPLWLSYVLTWQPVKSQISASATGTSGSMKNVSKPSLQAIRIAYPPLPEQRAIAEALSDVDALLGGLDRLIAKKRDLKQAAMRQLLTGQTRLPGFSGEWEVKRLGELGSTYGGLTGKTKADFGVGRGRYVTFMNVMTNVVIDCSLFEQVRVSPSESQNCVNEGDLLFNGSSETPEEVAMCSLIAEHVPNLFLNSFCFGFRLRDEQKADGLFLAYYLRANPGRELMKSLAQGSTRYNLSKGALLEASLRLPLKDEQTAIAAVLSDIDAELAALEARHDKTRNLKQAMMQELLTGKTRLV